MEGDSFEIIQGHTEWTGTIWLRPSPLRLALLLLLTTTFGIPMILVGSLQSEAAAGVLMVVGGLLVGLTAFYLAVTGRRQPLKITPHEVRIGPHRYRTQVVEMAWAAQTGGLVILVLVLKRNYEVQIPVSGHHKLQELGWLADQITEVAARKDALEQGLGPKELEDLVQRRKASAHQAT